MIWFTFIISIVGYLVLIDGSWIIADLEVKVLQDVLELSGHFDGQVKGANF